MLKLVSAGDLPESPSISLDFSQRAFSKIAAQLNFNIHCGRRGRACKDTSCHNRGFDMANRRQQAFYPKAFLAKVGDGRSIGRYSEDQIVYAQGDPADFIFYIQEGNAKLTVVSKFGKEAVVAVFGAKDFFGEGCLAAQTQRIGTVVTLTDSVIVHLEKAAILRVLREQPELQFGMEPRGYGKLFLRCLTYLLMLEQAALGQQPQSPLVSMTYSCG